MLRAVERQTELRTSFRSAWTDRTQSQISPHVPKQFVEPKHLSVKYDHSTKFLRRIFQCTFAEKRIAVGQAPCQTFSSHGPCGHLSPGAWSAGELFNARLAPHLVCRPGSAPGSAPERCPLRRPKQNVGDKFKWNQPDRVQVKARLTR